jgi:hypothetical protein
MSNDRRAQQIERLSRAILGTASPQDWLQIERNLHPDKERRAVESDRCGHEVRSTSDAQQERPAV